MLILIIVMLSICLWMLLGAAVLAFVDDDDRRLFNWYREAPNTLFQIVVLMAWPLIVYIFRFKGE